MQHSRSLGDIVVDVEIERVFQFPYPTRTHHTRHDNMANEKDPNHSVLDFASPQLQDVHSSIRKPTV